MDVQGILIETFGFGAAIITTLVFLKQAKQEAKAQGDESFKAVAGNFAKKILD